MEEKSNIPASYPALQQDCHLPAWEDKAILLVDLDAFFASVEQLDHPAWRNKPVIVGGSAEKHGVVSTCSYEARKFGVRSAMPASIAAKLCPDAIWTHGRFDRYREVSEKVMRIIYDETPFVQQVSIDEAFADITPTSTCKEHPVYVAMRIQERVKSLGITCSIGVGTCKSIAKIASDLDKPEGLTVVFPGTEMQFLSPLPVRKMSGIGPAAEKILSIYNIRTLGDLSRADTAILKKAFGKNAEMMRERALGTERSPIINEDEVKSISHEVTFAQCLECREDAVTSLESIASKVGRRLRVKRLKGNTVTVKIRYDDRSSRTAQCKMRRETDDEADLFPYLHELIDELWTPGQSIRLLGVAVTNFVTHETEQLSLMEDAEAASSEKRKNLVAATDYLKDRFGESVIRYGRDLKGEGNTTGTGSKNPADYK